MVFGSFFLDVQNFGIIRIMYKTFGSLSVLLGSKARREVIKELVFSPNTPLSIREVARRCRLNFNAVNYVIKQLERVGIITKKVQGKTHLLLLNQEHPFYLPLLEVFHKSYGLGYMLYKTFYKEYEVEFVILTYFYILQQRKGEYDVDIVFLGKPDLVRLNQQMEELENQFYPGLTFTVLSVQDAKMRILRQDEFLLNILTKPVVFVKGSYAKLLHFS